MIRPWGSGNKPPRSPSVGRSLVAPIITPTTAERLKPRAASRNSETVPALALRGKLGTQNSEDVTETQSCEVSLAGGRELGYSGLTYWKRGRR